MTWRKSLPASGSARQRCLTITDTLQTRGQILDCCVGEENLLLWVRTGVSA
jgi:hypothetical protein